MKVEQKYVDREVTARSLRPGETFRLLKGKKSIHLVASSVGTGCHVPEGGVLVVGLENGEANVIDGDTLVEPVEVTATAHLVGDRY